MAFENCVRRNLPLSLSFSLSLVSSLSLSFFLVVFRLPPSFLCSFSSFRHPSVSFFLAPFSSLLYSYLSMSMSLLLYRSVILLSFCLSLSVRAPVCLEIGDSEAEVTCRCNCAQRKRRNPACNGRKRALMTDGAAAAAASTLFDVMLELLLLLLLLRQRVAVLNSSGRNPSHCSRLYCRCITGLYAQFTYVYS